ncbi:hypothetical protein LBMAG57_39070 [Verrucomicrobiota bacterium]|nr:hypothetical protein LBMAG57_39070 [Verrucomicrobiota bacterium]
MPEKVILFLIGNEAVAWVVSAEILAEYREVLRRPKFGLSAELLVSWDERFNTLGVWPVSVPVDFPRDPKDAKFLACALAAAAEYFITGDRDFEDAPALGKTRVLSVGRFHAEVCEDGTPA